MSIGTRPDCVSEKILDLLSELSKETYLMLEYGVESVHDKTLELVNRQHTFEELLTAYDGAKQREIKVCLHIINGLPGESENDIFETAKTIGRLEPDGIKMHSLYIETGTQLYNLYRKYPWRLFTEEEYVDIAATCIEYMPESTVIHRIVGEAVPGRLFAPEWSKNKQRVINAVNKKLCERNTRQGARFVRNKNAGYFALEDTHVT